jgi:hypothetical protein
MGKKKDSRMHMWMDGMERKKKKVDRSVEDRSID